MAEQNQQLEEPTHFDASLYTGPLESVPLEQSVVGARPPVAAKHEEIMQALEIKAAPHNQD